MSECGVSSTATGVDLVMGPVVGAPVGLLGVVGAPVTPVTPVVVPVGSWLVRGHSLDAPWCLIMVLVYLQLKCGEKESRSKRS